MTIAGFERKGWARLPLDDATLNWSQAANRVADRVLADPALRETWLQCEGTWFVGVDALPSAPDGSIDGIPLAAAVQGLTGYRRDLHPAQLSVTFAGYPKPRSGDTEAAFRYRLRRDAAHVDGLIASAQDGRRRIEEPHAFILGLPLNMAPPGASPLVVWEGSHRLIGDALRRAVARSDGPPGAVDITEIYGATRREVFEVCPRVCLTARPGAALVLHRHLLHGIAPWQEQTPALPEGRRRAYFRPLHADGVRGWLSEDAGINPSYAG